MTFSLDRPEFTAYVESLAIQARQRRPVALDPLHGYLARSLTRTLHQDLDALRQSAMGLEGLPDALRRHWTQSPPEPSQAAADAVMTKGATRWRIGVGELLERLATDWPDLVDTFDLDPESKLEAFSRPLGDVHNHGRTVYRIGLSQGRSLVYKPRSVETEHALERTLNWMRANGCPLATAPVRVLSRPGYGWTEYVPTTWCTSPAQATTFYWRQGGFIALFWLLCAEDAISGNVVVNAESPVWVDTECTCVPEISCKLSRVANMPPWIRNSLLTTMMLVVSASNGHLGRTHAGLNAPCTADPTMVLTPQGTLRRHYREAVVRGFRDMYLWLLQCPQMRSTTEGPLSWWAGLDVRVLLRPTWLYAAMLELLSTRSGSDIEGDIAAALRVGVGSGPTRTSWPDTVVALELEALLRGDVPYWHTTSTSRHLRESDSTDLVPDMITRTGMERVSERALRLSEHDLRQQIWLLESYLGKGDADHAQPAD